MTGWPDSSDRRPFTVAARERMSGHQHAPAALSTAAARHRGRLAVVMGITAGIAAAEVAGALVSGSLVLLADAAHMAADAAGVGLSLLAVYMAARPATGRRTFGYARAEILAATANSLLLTGMAVFILVAAATSAGPSSRWHPMPSAPPRWSPPAW